MDAQFCVLASGSGGNSALVRSSGYGLLIDIGLPPDILAGRLRRIGGTWHGIHAVVLTHTHTDHWNNLAFEMMRARGIELYCHLRHQANLSALGDSFDRLLAAGLVRHYEPGVSFTLGGGMSCTAVQVPHDSDPTFGFRIDGPPNLFDDSWSVAYASDLGRSTPDLIGLFQNANILALEFNHDVEMQQNSGRPQRLIRRVLSDSGHLSNLQAANVVREVLSASIPGSVKQVVQLHLSRDCNRPLLAVEAMEDILLLQSPPLQLLTASQDRPTAIIDLNTFGAKRIRKSG